MSDVALRTGQGAGLVGSPTYDHSAPRNFLLVQVLRGTAALMVVWHHATLMENERLDQTRGVWLSGAGGVDLFFVISGFVMVLSSRSLAGLIHPMRVFLKRRMKRVVPMYWLVTSVKLLLALLLPTLAPRAFDGMWHIMSSYLFIPSVNSAGAVHPVLIVGWTLNYEAAFYVTVALGLGLRFPLVPYLVTVLPILGLVGWVFQADLPIVLSQINLLLLEFGYGALLAGIQPRLRARNRGAMAFCFVTMCAGFAFIQLNPQEVVRSSRPFVWGLAATLVVGSAVALEEAAGKWMPGWLLRIGDASYSNYLIHTLVLAAIGSFWMRIGAHSHPSWLIGTILCVAACGVAAEIVYRTVEIPMMQFIRSRFS